MLLYKFNANRHEIDNLFLENKMSDVNPVLNDIKDKQLISDLSKSLTKSLDLSTKTPCPEEARPVKFAESLVLDKNLHQNI